MREISTSQITDAVARMCQEANFLLPEDVTAAIARAAEDEPSDVGKHVLQQILRNAEIAAADHVPLCQDCGLAAIFVELGQDVHIVGGAFQNAIDEGVRIGYRDGYLRKSVVRPPIFGRVNTKDNTPALVYVDLVPGDRLRITIMTKGGGSENMSALAMLTPADGAQGVKEFVTRTVEKAGSNPCPPIIVGVGIGGTADHAMHLAKKALLRPVGEHNADPETAALEDDLLARVNQLGIGPAGFGGRTTALAVHVETHPCHMASLPVAVNIQCHSARHKEVVL
ncbi:MAG: fumarate hydratase [Chloroflexota bacterium]|nr:MAG: fumarate hydratase [Chloroflexota bacterium]